MYPFRQQRSPVWLAVCASRGQSEATCSSWPRSVIRTGEHRRRPARYRACLRRCNRRPRLHPRSHLDCPPLERPGGSIVCRLARCGRRAESSALHLPATRGRSLILDWEVRAHRVVAEFRAAMTGHADDPALRRLVEELSVTSAAFARCWAAHGVLAREGGERTFKHSSDGLVHYQQVSLSLAGWPDFRLTMLLAIPAPRD